MTATTKPPGRRVVVTGGSGLLGASLALDLSAAYDVVATYRSERLESAAFASLSVDLTEDTAGAIIAATRPDVIVHCAAATDVEACERDPGWAWAVNVEGTRRVAEAAAATGSRLIAISTDSVFSGEHANWREDDEPQPLNSYARTKLAAERVAQQLVPGCLVVRTVIYGWNAQDKLSLAEWILQRLERDERVPGFSDAYFTPLLANDLGDALTPLIERRCHGILHVAGRERISKHAFARAVAEAFGLSPSLVDDASLADAPFVAKRPHDTSLDCSLATSYGLRLPGVSQGLARFAALRHTGYVDRLKRLTMKGPT